MTRNQPQHSRPSAFNRLLRAALWLTIAAALTACGGSGMSGSLGSLAPGMGSSSSSTGTMGASCSGSCGAAMITMGDAAGDFDSYMVDLVSLTLTRSDGTVVETVPATTQVDFTQLVNLSEILSAAEIPAGRYVSVSMTLDYNGASIVVDNGTMGVPIAQANIINGANSQPLVSPNSQITVTLSLPSDAPLVVTPGTVAHLALDFDLTDSNAVTPSATNPTTVTVDPVLMASLVPDTTRQLHVRGELASVDTSTNSFVVNVRPFFAASGMNGQLTVDTTSTTTYSINGTAYTGSQGLAQLATLPADTMTAAYGTWNSTTQTFTASSVLVGSSVAGARLDSVQGTVVARTGDTLTVENGLICPVGPAIVGFQRTVTVTVGPNTMVSESGNSGSFTIGDISVGQHVQFFGTLSRGGSSSSSSSSSSSMSGMGETAMGDIGQESFWGNETLDATSGSAVLLPTQAVGTVSSAASGTVTLNLQSLDRIPASSFDFAGTGSSVDATASAYSIEVPPQLSTGSLAAGAPASFFGFVAPFGMAPPDFIASTLVNYSQANALLYVRWASPGVTAPFATLTASELLVSQATLTASAQHVIRVGSVTLDPSTLAAGLQIDPDTAATNAHFAIVHAKSRMIDTYTTFNDLVTALTTELNGTNAALDVGAVGPYDSSTGVFSAEGLVVVMND